MNTDSIKSRDRSQDEHAPASGEVTPECIRHRAHQIFEARNGAPGNATLDWLQAEQELRAAVTDDDGEQVPPSKGRRETTRV